LFDIDPDDVVLHIDDKHDPIVLRHAAMANGIRDEFSRREPDRISGLIPDRIAERSVEQFSCLWSGGRVRSKGRVESRRARRLLIVRVGKCLCQDGDLPERLSIQTA
jgi:hypothetical protein